MSRRLRSALSLLTAKLEVAEASRRRSNGLERAFFSHLAETEALVLQRERLMKPGDSRYGNALGKKKNRRVHARKEENRVNSRVV